MSRRRPDPGAGPPPPPGRRERERPFRRERERPFRRALVAGLLLSLLVHAALLLVVGRIQLGRLDYVPAPPDREPAEGIELLALRVVEEDAAELPEEEAAPAEETEGPAAGAEEPPPEEPPPEEEEEEELAVEPAPVRPTPAPGGVPGEPEPAEEEEGEALTNAERLRPRLGDERLWVDFRDRPFTGERLEAYARADSALRAILREWLDSLRLSEEQRRQAMDWTFGDGDERWGISSEGLHLGDITIPIPFGQLLQQSGPRAREARQALQDLMEIRRQDLRQDQEEVAEERRRAMRERSREQAEDRDDDTTSSGG